MGKLVVTEFLTLDGVMEDPGGAEKAPFGGWAFRFDRGEEGERFKFEELMAADASLFGRVTYDGFAAAWPTMQGTGEFGVKLNSMPKYVVSRTLRDPAWNNTTVLSGDLAGEVKALQERYSGDVLVAGSAQLVRALLAADLVDELRLMVFPVVLGAGKRLFGESGEASAFRMVEARQAGDVALLTLARRG